jgi:uncharacterized membrane protein YuzA (DUF378 family)
MMEGLNTARVVIAIIEAVGWLVVGFSGIAVIILLSGDFDPLSGIALALPSALGGLLLVVIAQLARAQIITAEATTELVELTRRQGGDVGEPGDPAPASDTPPGVERYRGRLIYKTERGFSVAGRSFRSKMDARTYVDRLKP